MTCSLDSYESDDSIIKVKRDKRGIQILKKKRSLLSTSSLPPTFGHPNIPQLNSPLPRETEQNYRHTLSSAPHSQEQLEPTEVLRTYTRLCCRKITNTTGTNKRERNHVTQIL